LSTFRAFDSAKPTWLKEKERGARVAYRLAIWIAVRLGRPIARLLLYPITAYFIATCRTRRIASRRYLSRALGKTAKLLDMFWHYHCFAATILDRFYLHAGQHEQFHLRMHGREHIREYVMKGQGCLLLGSHLGSFEMVRACAHKVFNGTQTLSAKMIMHERNMAIAGGVFANLDPQIADSIISIGSPDAMIRAKECLERGEFVGILGDRIVHKERTVTCRFFGEPVSFPAGPILLASILKVPVILFFGLYRGDRNYDVFFEPFAQAISLGRADRDADIQSWMQRYAARLEYHSRRAPYNWFNFYDYWREDR
jgi:predicted LPLAT superfamily acyltransferase